MRVKSSDSPPLGALMWPSSEVPAPYGMIGTRWVRATSTTLTTSSVLSTQITASGGSLGIQVMVLACWRRISSPVCRRSPKRWRSTAIAVATLPCALLFDAAGMAMWQSSSLPSLRPLRAAISSDATRNEGRSQARVGAGEAVGRVSKIMRQP